MAGSNGPGETGKSGPGDKADAHGFDDLERRRRDLEAKLATRSDGGREGDKGSSTSSAAGYGQAMKLSSEFIAGIAVGAGLGWAIDKLAGTSPWGLIVFLLLGFGAGVLNVLRSAGVVAEQGSKTSTPDVRGPDQKN